MRELLTAFVPAADEVGGLQRREGREAELFRRFAEQGHYAGRVQPSATRQGIYAAAPSGKLLASINTRSAKAMRAMLADALEAWSALPQEERYLDRSSGFPDGGRRPVAAYPEHGLVLRVHSRDLPRVDAPGAKSASAHAPSDWRATASNRDHAWFRAGELASFLPEERRAGARARVADEVVTRIVRLHLVDNVRGQVLSFAPDDVERAELWSEVVARGDGVLHLALSGASRAVAHGTWPVHGFRDRDDPTQQERGFETELLGRATWDLDAGRFVAFELVALGRRWGGTQYNGRYDDLAPAPIGVAFTLAGTDERVPPAAIWRYGWR